MISETYFSKTVYLAVILKQATFFKVSPVLSPPNSDFKSVKTFKISYSEPDSKRITLKTYIIAALVCLQFVQAVSTSKRPNHQRNISDEILAWLAFVILAMATINIYLTQNKGKLMELYFNNLMKFHKLNQQTGKKQTYSHSLNEAINLMTIPMGLVTGIVLSPFLFSAFTGSMHARNL